MTINENMTVFMGRPIKDFEGTLTDPVGVIYRLGREDPDRVLAQLQQLLADPNASTLRGLIISNWTEATAYPPVKILEALIEARDTLTRLEAFFLGDMTYSQCEISWIQQGDMSPFLRAYPGLLHVGVRGGTDLAFRKLKHESLRTLIVETGGLAVKTIKQICALELPALEHLELWLGLDAYGGDSSVEDLGPILEGDKFPRLRWLGLRNCMYTDELCEALIEAPVLESLSCLDLSLGTLSDVGAEHLLANPKVKELEALELRRHYLSEEMQARLVAALPAVKVNLEEPQEPSEDRYCAVTE